MTLKRKLKVLSVFAEIKKPVSSITVRRETHYKINQIDIQRYLGDFASKGLLKEVSVSTFIITPKGKKALKFKKID